MLGPPPSIPSLDHPPASPFHRASCAPIFALLFSQASYLSLDGIEEPKKKPTSFGSAFDFPFLYGSKAGGNNGYGNRNGTPGELPDVVTAGAEDATGLSFWNDSAPLDFSHGGRDGVIESHGGRDRAPSYAAAVPGAAYGCYECGNKNDGSDGEEEGEVDETALALAADSLLGYATPTADQNPSRDGEDGHNGDEDEQIDEAALALAADSLLGYDAPASGGKTISDALVDGDACGSYGWDNSDDVEEEEADETALAIAADGLLGYDAHARCVEAPPATSTGEVATGGPSSHPSAATSWAATGNAADSLLPGGSTREGLSANRHDGDAAAAGGLSPALLDRRCRPFLSSRSRVFSNPGQQQQQSGGEKGSLSTSDKSTDGKGGGAGGDAVAAATPRALLVVEKSFLDEDWADGPTSSGGGGGGVWVAIGANEGDGGGAAGKSGFDGETAGGGQKISGGCGGSTLEPFADGQRVEEVRTLYLLSF